jgi:hypothetical protein
MGLFLDDFCDIAQETVAVACDLRMNSEENSSTSEGLDVTGSLEAMLNVGMLAHSNSDLRQRCHTLLINFLLLTQSKVLRQTPGRTLLQFS